MDEPFTKPEPLNISIEERAELADLIQHPGWKVAQKVWNWHRRFAVSNVMGNLNPRDAGYWHGIFDAEHYIETSAKEPKFSPIGTSATESQLMARKR